MDQQEHADANSTSSRSSSNSIYGILKKRYYAKCKRAGTRFPIRKVKSTMAANLSLRIGEEAPVFMAAVLESLVVRLVSIAGLTAHNDMRSKINHHHLQICIRNDEELSVLLTGEDTSCTSNVVFSCFLLI